MKRRKVSYEGGGVAVFPAPPPGYHSRCTEEDSRSDSQYDFDRPWITRSRVDNNSRWSSDNRFELFNTVVPVDIRVHSPDMPVEIGERIQISIEITHTRTLCDSDVEIVALTSSSSLPNSVRLTNPWKNARIAPHESVELKMTYKPYAPESCSMLFMFKVDGILKEVVVPISSEDDVVERIMMNAEPRSRKRKTILNGRTVSYGDLLPSNRELLPYHLLGSYDAPPAEEVRQIFSDLKANEDLNFQLHTYKQVWETVLYMEEHAQHEAMELYNVENVVIRIDGPLFVIKVKGIADRKPTVLRNDIVRIQAEGTDTIHRGVVHKVRANELVVSLAKEFRASFSTSIKYTLGFQLNRTAFRCMHRAIDEAPPGLLRCLLPNDRTLKWTSSIPDPIDPSRIRYANNRLNTRQRQAVASILTRDEINDRLTPPFVLFGPPGTGKSTTLIEAITQVLKKNPSARILVTAPSNAAVDVALKMFTNSNDVLRDREIFRANAAYRSLSDEDFSFIKHYSLYDRNADVFIVPEDFSPYRIVFSTLAFSATVCNLRGCSFVPDYIFIDEAGHSLEPETLLPISATWRNRLAPPKLILAGDPMQLGPVLQSHAVKRSTIKLSMLERLMGCPQYVLRGSDYDARFVVDLRDNYRSHERLLSLPSKQFYNSLLRARGPERTVSKFIGWGGLPNPRVPFILHCMQGRHRQEGKSPSYYNAEEVSAVVRMVERIVRSRRCSPRSIGIISPYAAQCAKLRIEVGRDFPEIRIGTVEAFQGDERDVIIISTVRSTTALQDRPAAMTAAESFHKYDARFNLGFLEDSKRFNVSWTRARAMLVLIGNPNMYQSSSVWSKAYTMAEREGCFEGLTRAVPER